MRALLSVLILAFALTACNQTTMAVGSAVKNFFMTPVRAVSSLFTNTAYKEHRKETLTEKEEEGSGEVRYCVAPSGEPIPMSQLDALQGLTDKLVNSACQCDAWGDCPQQVCACEKLCPKGFDIFRHPVGATAKSISTPENGLAFRNEDGISQYPMTNGYCWGHARVTSQFNRLAFFKPETKPPHFIDSANPEEQDRAVKYYKGLIDKVNNNEAVDIPGFKNLQALSDHPALQSYIGDKMAQAWADHAMSWQGVGHMFQASKQPQETYQKFFQDVKERVDMGMQPTIVFTDRKDATKIHAVLVSHYETQADGSLRLCLRDNNASEYDTESCYNHMKITPDRGLYYSGWDVWRQYRESGYPVAQQYRSYYENGGLIGGAGIAHNENSDAVAQAASLKKKCESEKGCKL